MSQLAQATITKYYRLGGLNNTHLFSHSFRGWNSEMNVSVCSGSREGSLPGLQMSTFLLRSHMAKKDSKLSGVSSYEGTYSFVGAPL